MEKPNRQKDTFYYTNLMEILLIHAMSDEGQKIHAVREHELVFPLNDKKNNYTIFNLRTDSLSKLHIAPYQIIIFTSTFFDLLTEDKYRKIIEIISSEINKNAVKIAMPQDDYWISELRDEWLNSMEIDLVVSCLESKYWEYLYTNYRKKGKIIKGHTSLVNSRHITEFKKKKHYEDRTIDVFYRTKKTPLYPNQLGLEKCVLGYEFEQIVEKNRLKLNLDVAGKIKYGSDWLTAMSFSKSVISTPSGSSLIYKNKVDMKKLQSLKKYEKSVIDDILVQEFPENLQKLELVALGPRNLEASAVGCVQFITYNKPIGFFEPYQDFVPFQLESDSIQNVCKVIKNDKEMSYLASNSWETIWNFRDIHAEYFVRTILELVQEKETSLDTRVIVKKAKRHKYIEHQMILKSLKIQKFLKKFLKYFMTRNF